MKGSMTIEASIIIPLTIAIYIATIRIGIGLYQEIKKEDKKESIYNQWEVGDFYTHNNIKEFIGEKDNKE